MRPLPDDKEEYRETEKDGDAGEGKIIEAIVVSRSPSPVVTEGYKETEK